MERPAIRRLLADVQAKKVDCVVVYKVDRLSRSIRDFAKIMEIFEKHGTTFVSVTQQFNTTTSLGRLTLNILLSFAQFEREIISERTRDKQVAARGSGASGPVATSRPGLRPRSRLAWCVNDEEAVRVRQIFEWYLEGQNVFGIVAKCIDLGWHDKQWTTKEGKARTAATPCAEVPRLQDAGQRPLHRHGFARTAKSVPANHDAIIDAADLRSGPGEAEGEHATTEPSIGHKMESLLRGLIYCSCCGRRCPRCILQQASAATDTTSATARSNRRKANCTTRSVSAPAIEDAVLESIRRFVLASGSGRGSRPRRAPATDGGD